MSVAEQVMAALVNLPDEQQTVVLDFVEFLQRKKRSSMMGISQQLPQSNLEAMRETLRQVAGCAQDSPSDLSTNPAYLDGLGQ
jgi:sulfur transfer protein SufE